MQDMYFNIDHGYLEGLLRGFKSGILRDSDYQNLLECQTLEGEGRVRGGADGDADCDSHIKIDSLEFTCQ